MQYSGVSWFSRTTFTQRLRHLLTVLLVVLLPVGCGGIETPEEEIELATNAQALKRCSPSVSWSPETLEVALAPGGTTTVTATATLLQHRGATPVKISRSLKPFVKVAPQSIPPKKRSASVQLTFTFEVPADAEPRTIRGTITLAKRAKGCCSVEDEALPVELTIAVPSTTDDDLIPASLQEAFGADPTKADTDGDGLSDDFEIQFGYPKLKPDMADTDADGQSDAAQDTDGDGLTNLEEQSLGTGPLDADSDGDALEDGAEVARGTNPLVADTDGDGMPDGREVINGSNPTVTDANATITSKQTFNAYNRGSGSYERVGLAVVGQGDVASGATLGMASDTRVPGQVSRRFDIELPVGAVFETATVTLPYDPTLPEAANASALAIFTIDPTTGFWERLPSQVDATNATVSGQTSHFSEFFVANPDTLQESVERIPRTCDDVQDPNAAAVDVALVIDSSGSMTTNDPQNQRITAARNFVERVKESDRVAVVDFDSAARVWFALSPDEAGASAALGRIDSSGGTDIGAGVSLGISQLTQAGGAPIKALILLTDGQGSYNTALTQQMAAAGIRAFTIGLSGDVNEELLQGIADGTQGGYRQLASANDLVDIFAQFSTVFGDDGTDSDDDGLTDCQEIQGIYLTNLGRVVATYPDVRDSDGDGLDDGVEVGQVRRASDASTPWAAPGHSDPTVIDTDGDTLTDYEEDFFFSNPTTQFSDIDALSDLEEVVTYGTYPDFPDTDGDGLTDSEEVTRAGEGINPSGFDYALFDARFREEFWNGFLKGDAIDIDTLPELAGQISSGLAGFGDGRDFVVNLANGEYLAAALSASGVVPALGDAVRTSGLVYRFVERFPWQRDEVIRNFSKYFPDGIENHLPPIPPSDAGFVRVGERLFWGTWADYPKVTEAGRQYAQIGERIYTRHAVERMSPSGLGTAAGGVYGRSISPTFIEATIATGSRRTVFVDGVERVVYSSGSVEVVTEQAGRLIVTVNPFSAGR